MEPSRKPDDPDRDGGWPWTQTVRNMQMAHTALTFDDVQKPVVLPRIEADSLPSPESTLRLTKRLSRPYYMTGQAPGYGYHSYLGATRPDPEVYSDSYSDSFDSTKSSTKLNPDKQGFVQKRVLCLVLGIFIPLLLLVVLGVALALLLPSQNEPSYTLKYSLVSEIPNFPKALIVDDATEYNEKDIEFCDELTIYLTPQRLLSCQLLSIELIGDIPYGDLNLTINRDRLEADIKEGGGAIDLASLEEYLTSLIEAAGQAVPSDNLIHNIKVQQLGNLEGDNPPTISYDQEITLNETYTPDLTDTTSEAYKALNDSTCNELTGELDPETVQSCNVTNIRRGSIRFTCVFVVIRFRIQSTVISREDRKPTFFNLRVFLRNIFITVFQRQNRQTEIAPIEEADSWKGTVTQPPTASTTESTQEQETTTSSSTSKVVLTTTEGPSTSEPKQSTSSERQQSSSDEPLTSSKPFSGEQSTAYSSERVTTTTSQSKLSSADSMPSTSTYSHPSTEGTNVRSTTGLMSTVEDANGEPTILSTVSLSSTNEITQMEASAKQSTAFSTSQQITSTTPGYPEVTLTNTNVPQVSDEVTFEDTTEKLTSSDLQFSGPTEPVTHSGFPSGNTAEMSTYFEVMSTFTKGFTTATDSQKSTVLDKMSSYPELPTSTLQELPTTTHAESNPNSDITVMESTQESRTDSDVSITGTLPTYTQLTSAAEFPDQTPQDSPTTTRDIVTYPEVESTVAEQSQTFLEITTSSGQVTSNEMTPTLDKEASQTLLQSTEGLYSQESHVSTDVSEIVTASQAESSTDSRLFTQEVSYLEPETTASKVTDDLLVTEKELSTVTQDSVTARMTSFSKEIVTEGMSTHQASDMITDDQVTTKEVSARFTTAENEAATSQADFTSDFDTSTLQPYTVLHMSTQNPSTADENEFLASTPETHSSADERLTSLSQLATMEDLSASTLETSVPTSSEMEPFTVEKVGSSITAEVSTFESEISKMSEAFQIQTSPLTDLVSGTFVMGQTSPANPDQTISTEMLVESSAPEETSIKTSPIALDTSLTDGEMATDGLTSLGEKETTEKPVFSTQISTEQSRNTTDQANQSTETATNTSVMTEISVQTEETVTDDNYENMTTSVYDTAT